MQLRMDSFDRFVADIRHAAGADPRFRADASNSIFFARELLRVRSQAFETKYLEFEAQKHIPRNTEVTPADESYTYQVYDQVGRAGTRHAYTRPGPRADVTAVEATPKLIRPMTSSYGYDFQEVRASMQTGKRLPQRTANAARRAIAQEVDEILSIGGSVNGVSMEGLATLSGTLTYTVPLGAAGSKYWTLKTPDEVLADLNGMTNQIVTNSSGREKPDTMLLPLAAYHHISQTPMRDGSTETIMEFFRRTSPYIKTIDQWTRLDSHATAWTGGRAIVYKKDPEKLDYLLPVEFEQFAPQMVGFETSVNCHGRIGGVVLYYPKSVNYADEIVA